MGAEGADSGGGLRGTAGVFALGLVVAALMLVWRWKVERALREDFPTLHADPPAYDGNDYLWLAVGAFCVCGLVFTLVRWARGRRRARLGGHLAAGDGERK